jgi:hypothetical protein
MEESQMPGQNNEYLSRREAAAFLGVAPATLAQWYSRRQFKVPFYRIGRRVWYKMTDLQKFIESRVVVGKRRDS